MAKPRGFSSQRGLSFDRGPYRYALVPWQWITTPFPHWGLPLALGLIDVRPLPAQALAGGSPQGFAFCASVGSVAGNLIAQVPHLSEATTTSAMQDAWQGAMGYRPQGAKLVDLLADQLTTGADPTGDAGPKPLMPGIDGILRINIGGHTEVWWQRFRWGVHPHTNRVQAVLQGDFARLWEATNGADHCRRVLDMHCVKYRVDDWREFVPQRLRAHVPGRLPHATTITESFNKADAATLGPDLTWTETIGDWQVVSNQGKTMASAECVSRAEHDLSSDDHYAQCSVVTANSEGVGPVTRFSGSANTFYLGRTNSGASRWDMYKVVALAYTLLDSEATGWAAPAGAVIKTESDGSTQKVYQGGVEKCSATDTAITGNVRTGLYGYNSGHVVDDFEAADLGGGGGFNASWAIGSNVLLMPGVY